MVRGDQPFEGTSRKVGGHGSPSDMDVTLRDRPALGGRSWPLRSVTQSNAYETLRTIEEFTHAMFRAADDRALGRHHHGTLHQPRMFHQQVDDGTRRLVIGLVQSELGKDRILPDEICHRAIKLPDDLRQCLVRGLGLEVLDGVELDTTLLKNLQRARRRVSMRVVEDRDGGHKPIMAEPRPWGGSAEHSWVGSCAPQSIQPTQTR